MDLTPDPTTWRVLIVDDEPDNLSLASDFLEFTGAATAKAGGADEGLEQVDLFKPNLILLDLDMPFVDGWDMHRQLRAMPNLHSVPIVAVTALAMPDDADKVYTAGFDGYITKPFRVRELLDALSACIETFIRNYDWQHALPPESHAPSSV